MRKWLIYFFTIVILSGLSACTDDSTDVPLEDEENKTEEIQEPSKAETLSQVAFIKKILEMEFNTEVSDNLPAENHAFIVLGFALSEDGEMQETLINRLNIALKGAKAYPDSKIIVTGGVAKNGVTEADVMYEWLISNGVDKDRVIKENEAANTVENAFYSLEIAEKEEFEDITIITSASHMRRALVIFNEVNRRMMQVESSAYDTQFSHIAFMDFDNEAEAQNVTDKEMDAIYRDYMRAANE